MELPLNYIILRCLNEENYHNMSLEIDKSKLLLIINEIVNLIYLSKEKVREFTQNFHYESELSFFISKYYQYFEDEVDKITFDEDYLNELNGLLLSEEKEIDNPYLLTIIDYAFERRTKILELLGIQIKKDIYYYLLKLEEEIEAKYMRLCTLETRKKYRKRTKNHLINEIKKLTLKRRVLMLNIDNLLPNYQKRDLYHYADEVADIENNDSTFTFHLFSDDFDEDDVITDTFQRCLFLGEEVSKFSLCDRLDLITFGQNEKAKNSIITFYLTLINKIDKEINRPNHLVYTEELITIKYRLMYAIDAIYDTVLFMNPKASIPQKHQVNYHFIQKEVYFLIDEVFTYPDSMYHHPDYHCRNILTYTNNIIKKLIIETYYELTEDNYVITAIEKNKSYSQSNISTSIFNTTLEAHKKRTKKINE